MKAIQLTIRIGIIVAVVAITFCLGVMYEQHVHPHQKILHCQTGTYTPMTGGSVAFTQCFDWKQ